MGKMMINMKSWAGEILSGNKRFAMPIMTHPGIEFGCAHSPLLGVGEIQFTGKKVIDVVTDGNAHFEAIMAVNNNFPCVAATAVMDLTVEAEAFGCQIQFSDDEVPSVTGSLINENTTVESLKIPDLNSGRLQQYLLANRLAAENLEKPFFSGCIGPFSLAGRIYDMTEIMTGCYIEPDKIHMLLQTCTDFLKIWCKALKEQGTQGVIMAEPAAGLLSSELCLEFSSDYVRQVVEEVQDDNFMVVLHNCGNTGHCTAEMVKSGAAGLHFGNAIDMVGALEICPENILVFGNVDPVGAFKMGTPENMYNTVSDLLNKTSGYKNFILSSGCDTPPHSPLENIQAFYKALDDYNKTKENA
jgi:uroporphyrinogen decarboxylase